MKNVFFVVLSFSIAIYGCSYEKIEKKYYKNGQLRYQVRVIDGKKQGELIAYFDNGNIKGRSHYVEGKLEGKVISFDREGNIVSEVNYIDDSKNGYFVQFYKSGNKKEEGWFVEDKPDSIGYYYYESGKVQSRFRSKNGEVHYIKSYDENGYLISSRLPIKLTSFKELNSVEIELTYSEFEDASIAIVIGNIDSSGRLLDTLDYVESDNMKYMYKLDSTQTNLSGIVFEVKEPELTFEAQYHFEYVKNTSTGPSVN